jgi:hypothetical protein
LLGYWRLDDSTAMRGSTTTPALSAFCPSPGRQSPLRTKLAKRHRKDRASLRDLLALNVERHGRRNNDIRVVGGDTHVPWLAECYLVARSACVLTLGKHIPIPVVAGCWSLPYMRRHSVKNLHGVSAYLCHRLRVTVVEGIDVLAHRRHRIVGARHRGSPLPWCNSFRHINSSTAAIRPSRRPSTTLRRRSRLLPHRAG